MEKIGQALVACRMNYLLGDGGQSAVCLHMYVVEQILYIKNVICSRFYTVGNYQKYVIMKLTLGTYILHDVDKSKIYNTWFSPCLVFPSWLYIIFQPPFKNIAH